MVYLLINMQPNDQNQERKEEATILEVDPFNWQIPTCCKEGWASCPHVVKKQKPTKRNIGL